MDTKLVPVIQTDTDRIEGEYKAAEGGVDGWRLCGCLCMFACVCV